MYWICYAYIPVRSISLHACRQSLYTMYSVIVFTIYNVWYIYTIQWSAYICCVHYRKCIHTYDVSCVHWMYYLCVLGPVSLMGGVHYESRHVISCLSSLQATVYGRMYLLRALQMVVFWGSSVVMLLMEQLLVFSRSCPVTRMTVWDIWG